MNTITILGHLGHDVSIKTLDSGKVVGEFSVGQSENRKGEKHTNWFNVSVYGDQASNCKNYLKKGSHVLVIGTLNISKYTNKEGVEKTSIKVFANTVKFLDKKESGVEALEKTDFSGVKFDNDELPF